jgi:hypothetical protein
MLTQDVATDQLQGECQPLEKQLQDRCCTFVPQLVMALSSCFYLFIYLLNTGIRTLDIFPLFFAGLISVSTALLQVCLGSLILVSLLRNSVASLLQYLSWFVASHRSLFCLTL